MQQTTHPVAPSKINIPGTTPRGCAPFSRQERLRSYLNAYWLRPENAFWMTIRSELLATVPFANPSLDLCCGDGIFTFIHSGGQLDNQFDVYTGTDPLGNQPASEADMYDYVDDSYQPAITTPPAKTWTFGIDHKASLLAKASALGLYDSLRQQDANQPLTLPTSSMNFAYCNSIYWLTQIDAALAELARILQPGGTLVLHVKLEGFIHHSLAHWGPLAGTKALERLLGSRTASWPAMDDPITWEHRFEKAGFTIESSTPMVTGTHVRIWEVGLRPFAPMLIRMARETSPATLQSIKRDWVDLCVDLALPLCDPQFAAQPGEETAEVQYVLHRR